MLNNIKAALSEYSIKRITVENFEQAMEVYRTNKEFSILTNGKEATYETCVKDINAIPAGMDIENKIYVSIWDDEKIIGILDIITNFPNDNCIWIGLLMVHGDFHGEKIGSRIVSTILEAATVAKYEFAQLGVIDNNIIGINFWLKHGFKKIRESKIDNEQSLNIIVMEKQLGMLK